MAPNRFWPSPTQALLLGVILHRDPAAVIQSWREWKSQVDLDDLDAPSFQIMSLVYHRLVEFGLTDPDLPRIKGLHRFRWTQNQVASRGKRELLKALHRENIPALLLSGVALGQTVYPDPSARSMHDMHILAPPADAARAIGLLDQSGWVATPGSANSPVGCLLLHPDHGEVALHWRVMRSQAGHEDELWQAAQAFEFERTPARILCPADQLLHACEGGMHPSYASLLQWLVDCAFIIRNSPPPFDWPRLVDQTRKFQLSIHTRETLRYLRRHFEPSIPQKVIDDLTRVPVTLDRRIEYRLAARPEAKHGDLTHKFGVAACRYVILKDGGRLRQFLQDVPRFFRLLYHKRREAPPIFRKVPRNGEAKG